MMDRTAAEHYGVRDHRSSCAHPPNLESEEVDPRFTQNARPRPTKLAACGPYIWKRFFQAKTHGIAGPPRLGTPAVLYREHLLMGSPHIKMTAPPHHDPSGAQKRGPYHSPPFLRSPAAEARKQNDANLDRNKSHSTRDTPRYTPFSLPLPLSRRTSTHTRKATGSNDILVP